ncbi:MAG TPA: hypothetical protein VF476_10730 [Chitinophagaceae bacterium]
MILPDSFLTKSRQHSVSHKNIAGFPKYVIGSYNVISGKSAWTSFTKGAWTNESFLSRLFAREEKISLQEKGSFSFAGPNGDTAFVTSATYTVLSYSDRSGNIIRSSRAPKEYTGGLANYIAIIQTNLDTTTWTLHTTIKEIPEEKIFGISKKRYQFEGTISNGNRRIALKEVEQFHDGKKSIAPGLLGLTFEEEGIAAAVQFNTGSLKKDSRHFVWLRSGLSSSMQLVLTTVAAALLAREEEMNGKDLEAVGF